MLLQFCSVLEEYSCDSCDFAWCWSWPEQRIPTDYAGIGAFISMMSEFPRERTVWRSSSSRPHQHHHQAVRITNSFTNSKLFSPVEAHYLDYHDSRLTNPIGSFEEMMIAISLKAALETSVYLKKFQIFCCEKRGNLSWACFIRGSSGNLVGDCLTPPYKEYHCLGSELISTSLGHESHRWNLLGPTMLHKQALHVAQTRRCMRTWTDMRW